MTATPCDACIRAATHPDTGRFDAGCMSCRARALAQLPSYFTAVRGDKDAYREALQRLFGDNWREAHMVVRKWARAIAAGKGLKIDDRQPRKGRVT